MDNIIDLPASLCLTTSQIDSNSSTVTVNNLIGGWSGTRQQFYFNVKMRNVLGSMYDKYNKFVVSVVQIYAVNNAIANSAIIPVQLQMGGLSFENSSYDQVTQTNGYWAGLANFQISTAASGVVGLSYDTLSNCFLFRKGDPDVRIDFRFINTTTNQLATVSSNNFPTVSIIMKIQPLKE